MTIASRMSVPAAALSPAEPPGMAQAAAASQMTMNSPFSPGEPVSPYDGYSRHTRQFDFTTGYNIATRPRTHERVSFETLRGLIEAYDVASIALWHRIDSIRSLDWKLVAADFHVGDITDAVKLAMTVLDKPDRENDFGGWLAKWAYDILAYDAGCLYRLRNRAGRVVGLQPVDGTLIAPLTDYWGNSPGAQQAPGEPLPEAYVQYINGLPWNWLTRDDLIYQPYRPRNKSLYGTAPLESIILNANTDLRFQLYFLQRFTTGNVPEAFASAPETWSPDQIEQFQGYWDSFMYGDQSQKHAIKWIPGGSTFAWSNEKDFTDTFSLFLMRKSCAAFHVVPSDLGFTETVQLATGESQADVQHRIGDLPFGHHIERIITRFIQVDLGLPLRFQFDWGEEQDDRLNQAQADQIYVRNAVVSSSELRQMRFGMAEGEGQAVPRVFFTERGGPIPLSSLYAVAGPVDPATAAPPPGAKLPERAFTETPGVLPTPPLKEIPLAEQEFGPKAVPAKPPPQAVAEPVPTAPMPPVPVVKEDAAAGIDSDTGIYGYDLDKADDDEERAAAVKSELAAFRRFEKARRKAGAWRDFRFEAVDAGTARRLNTGGRQAVTKASGYSLSPNSGMISLDVPDGLISPLPGGVDDFHVTVVWLGPDVSDDLLVQALSAARSASSGVPGPLEGTLSGISSFPPSGSSDGKVPAFVPVTLPGGQPLRDALAFLSASEHPDWHPHVTVAYLNPGDPLPPPLPPVPVTFTHLSVHRGDEVTRFPLGGDGTTACCGADCCAGGCCQGAEGCPCGAGTAGSAPAEDSELVPA